MVIATHIIKIKYFEVKRMKTIRRYIYLAMIIVVIRFILGIAKIFDMTIEGLYRICIDWYDTPFSLGDY